MAELFANNTIGHLVDHKSTISSSYAEHLRKEHAGSKWGSTGWKYSGELACMCVRSRPYIKTILDFGCGKGTMGVYLKEEFPELKLSEYDPGIPGKDTMPSGQFDMVLTSDVLEHVEPELLDNTLIKLQALTKYVLFNDIACSPTYKLMGEGPHVGEDLHLIIEEPEWWRARFKKVLKLHEAEYQHREKASKKGRKSRCLLIHERV